jgi:hypothetical protein
MKREIKLSRKDTRKIKKLEKKKNKLTNWAKKYSKVIKNY